MVNNLLLFSMLFTVILISGCISTNPDDFTLTENEIKSLGYDVKKMELGKDTNYKKFDGVSDVFQRYYWLHDAETGEDIEMIIMPLIIDSEENANKFILFYKDETDKFLDIAIEECLKLGENETSGCPDISFKCQPVSHGDGGYSCGKGAMHILRYGKNVFILHIPTHVSVSKNEIIERSEKIIGALEIKYKQ